MFFMAMVLYPDVQKKAQKELDTVIGDARLPSLGDQDQLQYIGRIVQETLRWAPVTPLGEHAPARPLMSLCINLMVNDV